MTHTLEMDVAIIGAGTAGLGAYRAARARTERVVLIEAGPGGTTCARVGCMPSKLLIAAAEAAHRAREAEGFGVRASVEIDAARVLERVRAERDRFVGFVLRDVDEIDPQYKLTGRARFLDAHTLEVGGGLEVRVRAKAFVIATGSSPSVIPLLADLGDRLLVSDDVFELERLPESIAVFGPGVIGLELGQALARLGVRVRMFGVGGLVGPLSDPDVLAYARETFREELSLDSDAKVHSVRREGDGVAIEFEDRARGRVTERFERVLAATGRAPNVRGLGLEHTGIALRKNGVPEIDPATLRAGDSSIYLAGDVTGHLPLLHEAADEGRIAGENAARHPDPIPGVRRSPLTVVFSDPQIAIVGGGWRAVSEADPVVGEVRFDHQGRSRVMLRNRGILRVYADRASGRFLGAEMIGPDAEHLAHLMAWAHQARLSVASMLAMPFYHPVVEEGLRTALRDAHAKIARLTT